MNFPELQQRAFLVLLVVVSLAFAWILLPFYGAVFWASVLAIIFVPFYRRLLVVMHQRQNLAALTTLLLSLIISILPCTFITASLLQEVHEDVDALVASGRVRVLSSRSPATAVR